MTSVVRPFRGVSAEDRLAQRRADLIEAGFDEVGANGVVKLTMTSVCERAGLTQRYFYEQFSSREDLLVALFDTMFEEFFALARSAVEAQPEDLFLRARAAMEVFVDYFTGDQRKARLFTEAIGNEVAAPRKAESVRSFAEYTAEQAEIVYGPFLGRRRARLLLAAHIIVGGQADAAAQWLSGGIDLPRAEYIEELAHLFVAAVDAARGDADHR
ncbi:TetR/AcrR family transcriptional regulator [Nocardia sp. GCM10030253]|uniref:TetR/AcrR family transcriptional regulator n=1 Tax=Nocardia sp. GCM10030253 TaxID=3273404 RepID=UPI00363F8E8F